MKNMLRRAPWPLILIFCTLGITAAFTKIARAAQAPVLILGQQVSAEPLLGGAIAYTISLENSGVNPVEDKGYNLTITDTLPSGLTYLSANPSPTFVGRNSDGSTTILWQNIVDVEVAESLALTLQAQHIVITNTLPDGFTYAGNASLALTSVSTDTPQPGETALTWALPAAHTELGSRGTLTFEATVDPSYTKAPHSGQPLVSEDTLTTSALASLGGAGQPEIIVPLSNGLPCALNTNGTARWNVSLSDVVDSFGRQVIKACGLEPAAIRSSFRLCSGNS